jgi:TolB-like protein
MNFDNRSSSGEWQWLGKGLADMIITDLSASERLMIVERERLNEIVAELQLIKAGVVDSSIANQVGRIAKVDWVLFGSFLKEGGLLKIEAHILDLKTQGLLRVEWVEGPAEKALQLEKRLVQQLLERLHIPVTEEERRSIMYVPTDSISALEHYCRHLDFFDSGQWFDALLECRLAVRQDAGFIKARARLAELYYEIGKPEHALVEYQDLVEADRDNTFPEYIYYRMGRLLEDKSNDDAAIVLYEKILLRHPEYNRPYDFTQPIEKSGWINAAQFNSIKAIERLALIQEKRKKPFEAAQLFSKIVYYMRTHTFTSGPPWGDLHDRVRGKYGPMYWEFVRENRDVNLCPIREVYRIPQDGIADIKIEPNEVEGHTSYWEYVWCIAPPDKEIAEVDFNINTDTAFVNEDGSARVILANCYEPFVHTNQQQRELHRGNGWQRFNCKIKPGIRALIVNAQDAARWDVTIKCRDWTKGVAPDNINQVYVRLNPEWEAISFDGGRKMPMKWLFEPNGEPRYTYKRQPVFLMSFKSGEHTAQIYWLDGRCETKKFYVEPGGVTELFFEMANSDQSFYYEFPQQGSDLNLFVDHHQKVWLLWDQAYKTYKNYGPGSALDQESDLFYATSTDGKNWSKPNRLKLSSSLLDMRPVLQQDRSGTYWLIWISSRDSNDPKRLWIASSANGGKWTFPRKVTLPVTEKDIIHGRSMNYPSFAFTIDNQDTFWLIWQKKLFKSTDAKEWIEAEELSPANGLYLERGWDGFGDYSLSCDKSNHLLLLAKHKETMISSWGTNAGGKVTLWRRGNIAKWEFLGFVAEERLRSFCMVATGEHITFLVDKGNEGLLLRAYDDASGWSKFKKMDNASNFTSHNAIVSLGKKKYVAAYCGEQGIVVLFLGNITFYEEPRD